MAGKSNLTTPEVSGRFRKSARTVLVIVFFLVLAVVLLDPLPLISDIVSVARIRRVLPGAIAAWQTMGPDAYRVHVTGEAPLECLIDGELTVRDGQLVEVRVRANPLDPGSAARTERS